MFPSNYFTLLFNFKQNFIILNARKYINMIKTNNSKYLCAVSIHLKTNIIHNDCQSPNVIFPFVKNYKHHSPTHTKTLTFSHLYTLPAHKRFQGIAPSQGGSMLKEEKNARTRPLVGGISTTVPRWAGGVFQLFIALFL